MANLWKRFESLLPKQRYMIGTVSSVNSTTKTSVVALLSGESITVKGTSVAQGNTCLILDGIIVEEIPSLSSYNVTIY